MRLRSALFFLVVLCAACGGGGGAAAPSIGTAAPSPSASTPQATPPNGPSSRCSGATPSQSSAGMVPQTPALSVPSGLRIETVAQISAARELAALPNGDLLVGTLGSNVEIVRNAEAAGAAGAPQTFATLGDSEAQGVAFDASTCTIYVGTENHVWSIPYKDGDAKAESITRIADVRTGPLANPGDGDVHTTTSVAATNGTVYASMGSSCNGCTGETDATRAAIWQMSGDGSHMKLVAKRIRNAIALAVDPASEHLWAGGAGQDDLPQSHPYEFMDDVSAHAGAAAADYGWPYCEENHILYNSGPGAPVNCSTIVVPLVEFHAYVTHIGAAFYPMQETGVHALPQGYRGALLVTSHGSWHAVNGCTFAPEVDFVPMNGDTPQVAVNWGDPTKQWHALVSGFQPGCTQRAGRPTGITIGAQGSVFVADDQAGVIYRIRP
jgi:glucose/arabinose dehydrogenase